MDLDFTDKPGMVVFGLPDDGMARVQLAPDAMPTILWQNIVVLPDRSTARLAARSQRLWYPPRSPVTYRGLRWVVNMMTDADTYRGALGWLDQAFSGRLPVFNAPRAVAQTRRDLSTARLQGIEGLIVPKCLRIAPADREELLRIFHAEGFAYPVLVRPVSTQSAGGLIKIDGPQDWDRLPAAAYGRPFFLTQFVDFRSDRGDYVRVRVAFVGDVAVLRGYTRQPDWLITRAWGDAPGKADIDAFLAEVAGFAGWSDLVRVSAEVIRRGGLDFWGMDIGVIDARTFVLFEANPAMSILDPYGMPPEVMTQIAPYFDALSDLVDAHLARPEAWKWRQAAEFPSLDAALGPALPPRVW